MAGLEPLARTLIVVGLLLAGLGVLILLLGRVGVPRLPGDLVLSRDGVVIFIPLATSLLLSLLLTLLLNLLARR